MKEIAYDFIAGWCGGASSLIIGHPLDTIKVRLQSLQYKGIFDCILRTLRTEGAFALYKGMEFPLLSVGLINAIYFGGYSTLKPNFDGKNQISNKNYLQIGIAGAFGGAVQWTLACPVDVIKVKLQVQTTTEKFRGPFHCLRWILNNFGVRKGIFRAGTVMLIRDVPSAAAYIATYEALMDTFCVKFSWNHSISAMIAGGTAGVIRLT